MASLSEIDELYALARRVLLDALDALGEHRGAIVSLPEIAKATLGLVTLGTSPNPSRAARRLGMAPGSLSRWITRRTPPMFKR